MKRTLFKSFGLLFLVLTIVSFFAPETFGTIDPGIIQASFFSTSIVWNGKETTDLFLKPLFIGKNPMDTNWFKVLWNVQSRQRLNYFGAAQNLLKAYAVGFNGATGVVYTQRVLTTVRLKAEAFDDATELYNTVFEQILSQTDWNNLMDDARAELIKNTLITIFMNGVNADIYRQAWLADTSKELLTSGVYNGTPDPDYNSYDGIWKIIFANASTTPSALQIKRYAVSASAVAQVATVTITGSSGTANINVNGVNYLATFATDITTTTGNWITANTAALLLRGFVVTGTTTIILTSTIPGQPFAAPTITNASGNLTGSVAATTANTSTAALTAGQSYTILQNLYTQAPKVLKNLKTLGNPIGKPNIQDGDPAETKVNKVFLVSDSIYENYIAYLESIAVAPAFVTIVEGVDAVTFRGVPVIPMGWDGYLAANFPAASSALPGYAHRAIYMATGNLIIGVQNQSTDQLLMFWYNKDLEQNRFRLKFNMGVNYIHNELMAVAY